MLKAVLGFHISLNRPTMFAAPSWPKRKLPSRPDHRRACGILLAASLALLTALPVQITSGQPVPTPGTANAFFGLTNVWAIHLRVSPEDWNGVEQAAPAVRRRGPAGPAVIPEVRPLGPPPPPGPANGPLVDRFLGFTRDRLNYVTASVEIAGHKFEKVGLRLKGHSSLMSSRGSLKRPFKIDFNRFVKGQKFLGLSKLNLNNNAMDPTQIHEALAYDIFRAAGVPSSRTAFAKVFLTVPGLYERQYLGLYTVVEQVDGNFLKDRFGSDQGLLVKPELPAGLRYLGEDWSAYRKPYEAKNEPTPDEAQRFIEFIKLLTSGDETAFRSRLEEFMEVDQFLLLLAVTVAVADTDSVLGLGHNFYLFQRAPTHRIVWIPWDLNLSLGSPTGRQGMELSIRKPAPPQNRLVTWLLQDDHWSAVYRAHLQNILNSAFRPDRILRQVEQLRAVLREPIALESTTSLARFENAVVGGRTNPASPVNLFGPPSAPRFNPAPFPPDAGWNGSVPVNLPLTKWLTGRADSIAAQLAGRAEGIPMAMGGPGLLGGIRFDGPGGRLAEKLFRDTGVKSDVRFSRKTFSDALRRWFQNWDTDRNGALTEAEVTPGVAPAFGPPLALEARLPAPLRQRPRLAGPERFLGPAWFRRIDTDGNFISLNEWVQAFDRWFGQWDIDNDGALGAEELSRGFTQSLMEAMSQSVAGDPLRTRQILPPANRPPAPKPRQP